MTVSPLQNASPLARRSPLDKKPPVSGFLDGFAKAPPVPPEEMAEARKLAQRKHKVAKIVLGTLGATTVLGTGAATVATIAIVSPGTLGPLGPSLNQLVVDHLPAGAQDAYHWATDPNPQAEDASNYGQLYQITPGSGDYKVLAQGGQTSPDGNNIPAEAIKDGRVIIGFEGIDGTQGSYVRAFNKLFNSEDAAVPLNQPMLFIHEGHRPNRLDDIKRILHDYSVTKQVQAGEKVDLEAAFQADPAVETGYNTIKQALDQDLDVLVFAHSGGGAESVEALNLLSSQGYREEIGEHVQIVLMAGAAPAQDAVEAGVKPGNALYIGMEADLVAQLGHGYIDPHNPMNGLVDLVKDLRNTSDFTLGPMHSPDRAIVPNNLDHLQDFFDHGIGGTYLAPTPR
ncbi:MAG: hypothetical protein J0I12_28945 [Candidatus Eremiobacteraeota bacterium]|nr:hypothetical protein [Candidatus Eremiobacteraeota bacterium]